MAFLRDYNLDHSSGIDSARITLAIDETVREKLCSPCGGDGLVTCGKCGGSSVVERPTRCEPCKGSGRRTRGACSVCGGRGAITVSEPCGDCVNGVVICRACDGKGRVAEFVVADIVGKGFEEIWVCTVDGERVAGVLEYPLVPPSESVVDTRELPDGVRTHLEDVLQERDDKLRQRQPRTTGRTSVRHRATFASPQAKP
jgi:hypothetical protein